MLRVLFFKLAITYKSLFPDQILRLLITSCTSLHLVQAVTAEIIKMADVKAQKNEPACSPVTNWCWGQVWCVVDRLQSHPGHFASLRLASADRSATQGSKTLKALSIQYTVTHWPYSFLHVHTCTHRPFKKCLIGNFWSPSVRKRHRGNVNTALSMCVSCPLLTCLHSQLLNETIGLFPYSPFRYFVFSWQAISISHYSITHSVKLWLWVILPDRVVHLCPY